jgi:predicted transposase YbfD/YdcC
VLFPPAARTVEKNHGRIEDRALWVCRVDPQILGLAGAAQLVRIERKVDEIRAAQVLKHTEEITYEVTSLWPEEAGPEQLLQRVRDKWRIENGQHYRRDRTQDEDRCAVGETNSARLLSLFRSLAIFLHEQQRPKRGARKSLPDFERRVCQHPSAMIRRFMSAAA